VLLDNALQFTRCRHTTWTSSITSFFAYWLLSRGYETAAGNKMVRQKDVMISPVSDCLLTGLLKKLTIKFLKWNFNEWLDIINQGSNRLDKASRPTRPSLYPDPWYCARYKSFVCMYVCRGQEVKIVFANNFTQNCCRESRPKVKCSLSNSVNISKWLWPQDWHRWRSKVGRVRISL